jgi:hypothetical protein
MLSLKQSQKQIHIEPIDPRPIVGEVDFHTRIRAGAKPNTRPARLKTKATPPSGVGRKWRFSVSVYGRIRITQSITL